MPAPGPISITWSAISIASSSCSTTITVLPRSLNFCSVCSNLSLSLWCKPMLGSSNTYKTPERPDPIWLANLILWLSPPDNVPLFLEIDRYDNPTLVKNPNLSFISFKTCFEIASSCSLSISSVSYTHLTLPTTDRV